ncbi:hypothetical protein IKO18_02085 [bacterium]|nr:hypothetical protein [bacterium]
MVISSLPKKTSSAALPQRSETISSRNLALEYKFLSSSGVVHVTPNACHLRTIDIFSIGSVLSNKCHVTACHNS